jgi:hypothetical protein
LDGNRPWYHPDGRFTADESPAAFLKGAARIERRSVEDASAEVTERLQVLRHAREIGGNQEDVGCDA